MLPCQSQQEKHIKQCRLSMHDAVILQLCSFPILNELFYKFIHIVLYINFMPNSILKDLT